ncbi:hypothetical protein CLV84_0890 [Neolewinella xylanilytica]|uniref:Uncharacterized protein n=1 Tax=Neolewinella xylanilytica TaxID=1514080 RepID=A0A2S6I8W1_9BACT|nr:hypothetical protein [Neolewinella xylanilytica]PPK87931.1 hypothetical protein CLV84_0890 [Neolewinella xylanilytica]
MTEKFLRAPHWKLFVYSFGVPFLLQLLGTAVSLSNLVTLEGPGSVPAWPYYLSSAGSLAIGGVLYGWMWAVGYGLQQRMPREFRRPTIGFGAVLATLATLCLGSLFYSGDVLLLMDESNVFTLLFWTVLPLLIVWMIAHLYCATYLADLVIFAEEEREPTTHELMQLALLIWAFPIGVWIVQPRINRLARRARQGNLGADAGAEVVYGDQSQVA